MLQRVLVVLLTVAASAVALLFAFATAAVLLSAGLLAWAWTRWRGHRPLGGNAGAGRGSVVIEGEFRDVTNR